VSIDAKTKAVAGLAVLDIVRQVVTAWAARRRAEREQLGLGQGIGQDVRRLAHRVGERTPDLTQWEFERSWPPVHRRATAAMRLRAWAPVFAIITIAGAAIIAAARHVSHLEPEQQLDETIGDSRVAGAIRSGSHAIDAGVQRVVEGGSHAAVGTAAAVAAGSSAVRTAAVDRARAQVDERVVAPAKRKVTVYGVIGVVALTAYVILIATAVTLLVGAVS
jgi:hypothetical protein